MEKNKEYKPIVVVYVDPYIENNYNPLREGLNKAGYENILVFGVSNIEPRIEIISVDKATVIEDIQKYIDDNQTPKEGIFAQHLNMAAEKRWEKEFGK